MAAPLPPGLELTDASRATYEVVNGALTLRIPSTSRRGRLPARLAVAAWDLLATRTHAGCGSAGTTTAAGCSSTGAANGSRVWCSSADCGNRARARRHYARHAGYHRSPEQPVVTRARVLRRAACATAVGPAAATLRHGAVLRRGRRRRPAGDSRRR